MISGDNKVPHAAPDVVIQNGPTVENHGLGELTHVPTRDPGNHPFDAPSPFPFDESILSEDAKMLLGLLH